nr:MAG TPA: hypothetical protein [Caudoviricetes sp.]
MVDLTAASTPRKPEEEILLNRLFKGFSEESFMLRYERKVLYAISVDINSLCVLAFFIIPSFI